MAGRGADRKTRHGGPVAVKRQPGTASAGQTGTVPPQGGDCHMSAIEHSLATADRTAWRERMVTRRPGVEFGRSVGKADPRPWQIGGSVVR